MKQVKKASSKKPADMDRIAGVFLNALFKNKQGDRALVVGLSGDLGAGKTAFVQAAARYFGVKNKINSPTFVIIKNYELPARNAYSIAVAGGRIANYKKLFHIDAYRLKNEKELLHLGWNEIVANKEHLVFIEWPENVKKVMPKSSKFISISHGKGEHERMLYLS